MYLNTLFQKRQKGPLWANLSNFEAPVRHEKRCFSAENLHADTWPSLLMIYLITLRFWKQLDVGAVCPADSFSRSENLAGLALKIFWLETQIFLNQVAFFIVATPCVSNWVAILWVLASSSSYSEFPKRLSVLNTQKKTTF